jgi:hypothetical protein
MVPLGDFQSKLLLFSIQITKWTPAHPPGRKETYTSFGLVGMNPNSSVTQGPSTRKLWVYDAIS